MCKSFIITVICGAAQYGAAQNLLTNGDFSLGTNGFSSGYAFVSSGQSTLVGSFGIRTISTDFNPGYTSFGDHTTGSGNMMLADGAPSASTPVWSETVAVETSKNYAFTGWAASSDGSNPAQLHFTVNGIVVGADFALSANSGSWQKFDFIWGSGTATSAQIAIYDTLTIDAGNDFALDDLSFATYTPVPVVASIYQAVEIDWNSQVNVNYQVQYADAVATNAWFNLGGTAAGTGSTMAAFDSSRSNPQRFYRVEVLP